MSLVTHWDRTVRDSPSPSFEMLYRIVADPLPQSLAGLGLGAMLSERVRIFCPGSYEIAIAGRKIGGIAQRWRDLA